jgi:hypothetical protein
LYILNTFVKWFLPEKHGPKSKIINSELNDFKSNETSIADVYICITMNYYEKKKYYIPTYH